MHLFYFASPLEGFIDTSVFETTHGMINQDNAQWEEPKQKNDIILARRVLAAGARCGNLQGRELVAYYPSPFLWRPIRLYFTMLTLDRGPQYWIADMPISHVSKRAAVVRIDKGIEEFSQEPIQDDLKPRVFPDHQELFRSNQMRVYCPAEGGL